MQDRILVRTGMQYELRLNLVGEPFVFQRSAIARLPAFVLRCSRFAHRPHLFIVALGSHHVKN